MPDQPAWSARTRCIANALRSALRGIRTSSSSARCATSETIRLALTAAETSHQLFATLHTSSAASDHRPDRRRLPGGGKGNGRSMLRSLRAVVSQTLLQDQKDGMGRVAAHEIMIGTRPSATSSVRTRWRRCTHDPDWPEFRDADAGSESARPGAAQRGVQRRGQGAGNQQG